MSDGKTVSSVDTSFLILLTIVFITLKLCGVINWSWWLVTLPLWGGWAVVLVCGAICALLYVFIKLLD